jgi:hypothetical protein
MIKARPQRRPTKQELLSFVIADITGGSCSMDEAEHAGNDAWRQLLNWNEALRKSRQNDKQARSRAKKKGVDPPARQTDAMMLKCYHPIFAPNAHRTLPDGTIVKQRPVPTVLHLAAVAKDELNRSLAGELASVKSELQGAKSARHDAERESERLAYSKERAEEIAAAALAKATAAKAEAAMAREARLQAERQAAHVRKEAKAEVLAHNGAMLRLGGQVASAFKEAGCQAARAVELQGQLAAQQKAVAQAQEALARLKAAAHATAQEHRAVVARSEELLQVKEG